jgi:glycerol-3-phosphate dehydrogenase (NAD(P)+)
MTANKNISIAMLGAGSWGLAVANLLSENSYPVTMWEFNKADCDQLQNLRELPKKLPGIKLADSIIVTNDIKEAVSDVDYVFCAVPSQYLRSALKNYSELGLKNKPIFINLAKGIEVNSLKRMSEVISESVPEKLRSAVCTLSGPSHAEEVAKQMPTVITVACSDEQSAHKVQSILKNSYFRVYTSNDILGVELAGSLKNVIALAAGMLDGLKLGDNTRGALLTRGLAEIVRLGVDMGADPHTFSGLAGIGDLVTTCLSKHSRNRFVGEQIGKGRKLGDVIAKMPMVAEGVETTKSAFALGKARGVEMPITEKVHSILFENIPPLEAITDLMSRDPKSERWN